MSLGCDHGGTTEVLDSASNTPNFNDETSGLMDKYALPSSPRFNVLIYIE